MITPTPIFIDALVLQPRPSLTARDIAFISYLERRILHARDEFAREVLYSVLEAFVQPRPRTSPNPGRPCRTDAARIPARPTDHDS